MSYITDNGANHSFTNAQLISDGTVFGTIEQGTPNDFYMINAESGKTYSFSLKGIVLGDDYDLYLYNSSRSMTACSANYSNYDENITYTATYTGVYYIAVLPYISNASDLHNYQLMVYSTNNAPDSYEPNDSKDTATAITNGTIIYPTLNISTDEDWFVLDTAKTGKISVTMRNLPSDCDYDMTIYDSTGAYVGGSYANTGLDEKYAGLISTTGKYYIRVYSCSGSNPSDTYELKAGVYTPDSYELNDDLYSILNSQPSISIGNCFSATLDNVDDTDCFKFNIESSTDVGVRLQNIPSGMDYDLVVYSYSSSSGNFVEAGRSTNGSNSDETVISQLAAGSYYIKIYSYSGSSETQSYKLSVTDESAGMVRIDFDKTYADVEDIITATLSVDRITNFAGHQVNIEYDPEVVQPVDDDLLPYSEDTVPAGANILINSNYSPVSFASNDINTGVLNFSSGYINQAAYKQSGIAETSGTLAVIKFKVLKSNQIQIKFDISDKMPGSTSGVYLYDWNGDTITGGFTVQQPQTVNNSLPVNPQSVEDSTVEVNSGFTLTGLGNYKVCGYICPDFSITNTQVKSGFTVGIVETSYSATTDSNGYFEILNVPSAINYSIKISKDNYLDRTISNVTLNTDITLGRAESPVFMWAGDIIPVGGVKDSAINMSDIMNVAKYFNTASGDGKYYADYDFNKDNAINIAEIMTIARHFNKTPSDYDKVTAKPLIEIDFIDVAFGFYHTVALSRDGTVWTWGKNGDGQLGDGTEIDRSVPVQVNITGVKAISAGGEYSVALKDNGTVWAWGNGSKVPVQVGITEVVKAISTGWNHTLALDNNGTVWAWGNNEYYQLGDGTNISKSQSAPAHLGITGVKAISAGGEYSVAIKGDDGVVWAWGYNTYGQLGDGTTNNIKYTPVQTGISGVKAISAGSYHTVAIKGDNGAVWTWGKNEHGQLGDGTNINKSDPVPLEIIGVKAISARGNYTMTLKEDGTVLVWGSNTVGQLGDGTNIDRNVPEDIGISGVKVVSAGGTCAAVIKNDGTVWGWGKNCYMQLGNGQNGDELHIGYLEDATVDRNVPVQVAGISDIKTISSGYNFKVVLKKDGTVWAWGDNTYGQLGNGTTNAFPLVGAYSSAIPVQVTGLNGVKSISVVVSYTLALKEDGTVWAWGGNSDGNIGDGTYYDRGVPVQVTGLTGVKSILAAGTSFAIKEDGTVWAWGNNYYGQLGDGTTTDRHAPVQIGISGVKTIFAGNYHTVAIKEDGTVWAWGQNDNGQLGDGTTTDRYAPVQISISGVKTIFAQQACTIALKEDETVWVWGRNNNGQLGDGTTTDRYAPVQAGISGVKTIFVQEGYTIALKEDGTVWAWGSNDFGQLGDETTTDRYAPVQVIGINGVKDIGTQCYVGYMDSPSALNEKGNIWQWGRINDEYLRPIRATDQNDANLKYITVNNQYIADFDENVTDYTVVLPIGVTNIPIIKAGTYNPYASSTVTPATGIPGTTKIEVTAQDGLTKKTYNINFVLPPYAEFKPAYHFGEEGTGASGNFSRTYTDMEASAPGFELVFSRTYNSGDKRVGSLGMGWSFGFESKIEDAVGYSDVKRIILPTGSVNLFKWDGTKYNSENSRNILSKQTDGSYILTTKDQYTYGYNAAGYLVWMKDRNGNTVTINVDSSGKVQWVKDQADKQFNITYENGHIKTITDVAGGRTVTYSYNANGCLTQVTDPCGINTYYNYYAVVFDQQVGTVYILNEVRDHNNNLVEKIIPYEDEANKGKIKQTIDANGNTFNYDYYPELRRTVITDSNNRKTTTTYNDNYDSVYTEDADGNSTTTEFYLDGNENKYSEQKSVTDHNGNTTQYERDEKGNYTKITNPDGTTRTFNYDTKNNITFQQDEEGNKTYYVYDSTGTNLQYKIETVNKNDTYDWRTVDSSVKSQFAVTSYEYYTGSECTTLGYKAKGLLKSVTEPMNNTTMYTYYADGNIKTVSNPETFNVTTYEYNAAGWKTAEITAKGYRTEYIYNNNGQLEKKTVINPADATKNGITRITYDNMGRKTQEISPNQYNALDDDLSNHAYNNNTVGTRYTYNSKGQVTTVTDAENNITKYDTYDLYGNVTLEEKPNGGVYKYEYDAVNRLSKIWFKDWITDGDDKYVLVEEYTYTEGLNPRRTVKKYFSDTETAQTTYISDYAGNLTEQQNPDGTKTSTVYYGNGKVKSTTDANGNTTYYYYDKYDSASSTRYDEKYTPFEKTGSTNKYTYTRTDYDKNGRKISEKIGKNTVLLDTPSTEFITTSYVYYKDGKLKQVSGSSGRKTVYSYDDDRNAVQEDVYTSSSAYNTTTYVNNYLGKPSQKTITVRKGDLSGNAFTDDTTTSLVTDYEYNKDGTLLTVTTPDGVATAYGYDKMGRQTSVSQPGKDENNNSVTITTSTTYNWEGKPLTATDANNNTTTYSYNQRGMLEKVTDADNGVAAYYYDRAGRKIAEVAPNDYDSSKDMSSMNRIEYAYDKMDRVKTKSYTGIEKKVDPVTFSITSQQSTIVLKAYKYDNNGNVIKELDALGYESDTGTDMDSIIISGCGTEYTYNLANKVSTVLDPVSKDKNLAYSNQYVYDALGRKTSETNANGVITIYSYDDSGNVLSVKVKKTVNDSEQTIKSATYDYLGNMLSQTDGRGNTTTFEYNALNKLRKTVIPGDASIDPNTMTYQYDVMGRLKKQENIMGRDDLYSYDNQGRVISYTQQKQDETESITVTERYDKNGNKRFETDGNLKTKEYTYNTLNKLVTTKITVSGVEQTTTYGYDKNGNQTTVTDWRTNTYTNVYDNMNRLIEKYDPDNKCIQRLEYNHNNLQTRSYDAFDTTNPFVYTQFVYDKDNRLISTTDPENHTTSQTYDNVGNISTKTDGRGNCTTYEYDEFNGLVTVTNAKNEKTYYTYDLNNNMLTQKDGKGNTTTYVYNVANKASKRYDNGGENVSAKTETYEYNADGSLEKKTNRNGNIANYTYDIHGRLQSYTIGTITISYTYDGNGNRLTVNKGTETIARTYDELNRVLTKNVSNIGTSQYQYDITTNMGTGCWSEQTTDPKGNITTKAYDRLGRLASVTANGGTTTYTYNDNGSRQSVVYPDGAREDYTYYKDNLLWTLKNKKSGGTELDTYTYTYDAAHNQLTKVDSKGTTTYTYDVLNRLAAVTENTTIANNRITGYTYDSAGNRLTETISFNGNTTVSTYAYNDQNRLTGITRTVNNVTDKTVAYTYDNNGNQLSSTTTPYVSGIASTPVVVVNNTYDNLNQLEKTIVTQGTQTISSSKNTYDGEGHRIARLVNLSDDFSSGLGKWVNTTNANTDNSQLTLTNNEYMRSKDGDTTWNNFTMEVDVKINTSAAGLVFRSADNNNFYMWQLSTANGLRPQKKVNGTLTVIKTVAYTFALNTTYHVKIVANGTTIQTYINGTLIDTTTDTAFSGGKVGFRQSGTESATFGNYMLNSLGEPFGILTRYLYENDKVVLELDSAGAQIARNVYGTNLLSRTVGTQTYYYMYNGHGDVTALLDPSTNVVAGTYYYDAFGNILSQTGTVNNNITYAGYQYDKETGLYYLNARMYDPLTARFLQEDTYTGDPNDPLSLNLYTYCHNEPIMYIDPTGYKEKGDVLKEGDSGYDVVLLQKMLESAGYFHLPKDTNYGYFGDVTLKAVEKWQKDKGLKKDGLVGDKTWSSLGLLFEGQSGYSSQYQGIQSYKTPDYTPPSRVNSIKAKPTTKTSTKQLLKSVFESNNSPKPNEMITKIEYEFIPNTTIGPAPEKDVIKINTKLGQGLEGKIKVLGVEADLGGVIYYPNNFIAEPKQTCEINANIKITNQVFIGFEASGSRDPRTQEHIDGSNQVFLGVKIGKLKLGFGDLPDSQDITAKTGIGGYTPFIGGEVEAEMNLSEAYRRIKEDWPFTEPDIPNMPQPNLPQSATTPNP